MNELRNLFVGNIQNSISKLIYKKQPVIQNYPYALITSIDSCYQINKLLFYPKLKELDLRLCNIISEQLLLLTNDLILIHERFNIFNGFDEIWFFSDLPKNPVPKTFTITGPTDVELLVHSNILEWMIANNCKLGIGDGIGLNYISIDSNTVKILTSKI
ncbi:MAG: hypothetical protein ACD_79C01405G0003 [uncultured bacterium]|nr:MAG: hypothetical protein ACD_79C01405G0003 [uncultured bacterium]